MCQHMQVHGVEMTPEAAEHVDDESDGSEDKGREFDESEESEDDTTPESPVSALSLNQTDGQSCATDHVTPPAGVSQKEQSYSFYRLATRHIPDLMPERSSDRF